MADPGQLSVYALFAGLIFLTYRDFTASQETFATQKDIKAPKLSNFAGPTLKFMFW